jgi:hypothetical protein
VAEPEFDPIPILVALAEGGVDFVVIGGVAGAVYGSSYPTFDVDVAYARDHANLEQLAAVLRRLGATLRGAPKDLPFQLDAETLDEGGNFTFDTHLGKLDVLAYPAGAPHYDQLRTDATVAAIQEYSLRFASLDHLIAMKEAAGRTKDQLMATEYRTLSDELRRPPRT